MGYPFDDLDCKSLQAWTNVAKDGCNISDLRKCSRSLKCATAEMWDVANHLICLNKQKKTCLGPMFVALQYCFSRNMR